MGSENSCEVYEAVTNWLIKIHTEKFSEVPVDILNVREVKILEEIDVLFKSKSIIDFEPII
jgi:hypothetical protein